MRDSPRAERILRLLLVLLAEPYRNRALGLAKHFEVDVQSIKRDLKTIQNAGLTIDIDREYRYAVLPKASPVLKKLLPLSDGELALVYSAVKDRLTKRGEPEVLLRKLESVRDFQQLGLRGLRAPMLAKIDSLQIAIDAKRCVRLIDYRSTNSNSVGPRLVEPFHLDVPRGILHAYDLGQRDIRHFKLDRFTRVETLDEAATHTDRHQVLRTAAFNIDTKEQVRVHLVLTVAARNDLTERFPAASAYLDEADEVEHYDFDAQVNARFYGVLSFCLANWSGVEVRAPEELRAAMRAAATTILN